MNKDKATPDLNLQTNEELNCAILNGSQEWIVRMTHTTKSKLQKMKTLTVQMTN